MPESASITIRVNLRLSENIKSKLINSILSHHDRLHLFLESYVAPIGAQVSTEDSVIALNYLLSRTAAITMHAEVPS